MHGPSLRHGNGAGKPSLSGNRDKAVPSGQEMKRADHPSDPSASSSPPPSSSQRQQGHHTAQWQTHQQTPPRMSLTSSPMSAPPHRPHHHQQQPRSPIYSQASAQHRKSDQPLRQLREPLQRPCRLPALHSFQRPKASPRPALSPLAALGRQGQSTPLSFRIRPRLSTLSEPSQREQPRASSQPKTSLLPALASSVKRLPPRLTAVTSARPLTNTAPISPPNGARGTLSRKASGRLQWASSEPAPGLAQSGRSGPLARQWQRPWEPQRPLSRTHRTSPASFNKSLASMDP